MNKEFEAMATVVAVIGSENRGLLLEQAVIACDYLERESKDFDRQKFIGLVLGTRARIEETLAERGRK